ncbi:putative Nucleolar 27S pre-rRNA processing Urb2/Npa2 C-terminal domain-containing protein [Seiridium cardinale]|uniref:Nucleolar 27S pre-rRNA processing Urb2/Npa2 C-terminal domain-containing protein n=1 Tax=Seiridium cardinale TaxID=138064 RepID=A0ABR2XVA5_9PEZI
MTNGDFHASQLALIKSARSLDADTRSFGEKINDIWRLLTAAKGGKSCAAEETILRWFLKHMDGSDETAEQIRRYPLTWTTIGCLFERISLFSLSRIFLERKFISVLQQSAKDISKPQSQDTTKASKDKKRKRDEPITFDIESLRSPQSLLFSAAELFEAIRKLLDRLDGTTSRDTEDVLIGAEHIKSLFRVPVEDAKELVAPLLWTCAYSLDLLHPHGGLFEEQDKWPQTLIALWDLHLGGAEDSQVFASHLYYPCCIIIDRLSNGVKVQGNLHRKHSWKRQMDQFVMKNLVNPARSTYTNNNELGVLDMANAASLSSPTLCIKVLWRLTIQMHQFAEDPITKKARLTWAQSVFKLLLTFAEEQNVAESVVDSMLDTARFYGCSPELDTLAHVCKSYCFQYPETDWPFLSNVIQCDSDVFLLNNDILDTLLGRVTSVIEGDELDLDDTVEDIINPLMEAFAKARDLTGFVKKWHSQLAQLLGMQASVQSSPWCDRRAREQYANLMEGSLSVQQVVTLVDWLQAQADDDKGAFLVILDAVCLGARNEAYITALNSRLLSIVVQDITTLAQEPALLASRWRLTSIAASWSSTDEVNRIWGNVKGDLSSLLSDGSLLDPATFEAFDCCSKFCLANFPDGKELNGTLTMAITFLNRIVAEVKDSGDVAKLTNYLDLTFRDFPALGKASKGGTQINTLIGTLYKSLESDAAKNPQKGLLACIFKQDGVEDEEELIDNLIQPLLSTLGSTDVCGWTSPSSESTITALLTFPPEVFSKDRRKRLMSSWKKWKTEIDAHALTNARFYKLVLRLLIGVMAQPTFYDDMAFEDVAHLPLISSSETLRLVDRLAQLMISQVMNNAESSTSYRQQMLRYVQELDVNEVNDPSMPLVLLKSIVISLKGSTSKAKQAVDIEQVTETLREVISHSISELSSKLKKPGKLAKDEESLLLLDLTLRAAAEIGDSLSNNPIKLSSKVVTRLQSAGEALTSEGVPAGWRLQTFLAYNQEVPDAMVLLRQMSQSYSVSPDSQSVTAFVDAVTRGQEATAKLGLLYEALKDVAAWKSPCVPYMIVARIIETIQVSSPLFIVVEGDKTFDLASAQTVLGRSLTSKATSLEQFKNTARVVELLLDKHANSMTQVNVEQTLAVISTVCSGDGPRLGDPELGVAGEIFDTLYRLAAIVIKRHRLRLEGHHHLLVTALQVLLRVLLANPADSKQTSSSFLFPPWLDTRLKARHGAKFTRLLTLVCEPSAASVARGKHNSLDSATDAVKRSAGQHMFWVIALYIKLQLEGDVSRDMRKELATGINSILTITPESSRRVLSEAVDESGRVIFRTLFSEWKKFGKWSGV